MNFPINEDCLHPFNEHMNLTIHIWSQGKKFVIKGEKERTKKQLEEKSEQVRIAELDHLKPQCCSLSKMI